LCFFTSGAARCAFQPNPIVAFGSAIDAPAFIEVSVVVTDPAAEFAFAALPIVFGIACEPAAGAFTPCPCVGHLAALAACALVVLVFNITDQSAAGALTALPIVKLKPAQQHRWSPHLSTLLKCRLVGQSPASGGSRTAKSSMKHRRVQYLIFRFAMRDGERFASRISLTRPYRDSIGSGRPFRLRGMDSRARADLVFLPAMVYP